SRCRSDKTLNGNQTRRRFSLEKFKAGSMHSYSVRLKNNLLLPSLDSKQEHLIILFGAARERVVSRGRHGVRGQSWPFSRGHCEGCFIVGELSGNQCRSRRLITRTNRATKPGIPIGAVATSAGADRRTDPQAKTPA